MDKSVKIRKFILESTKLENFWRQGNKNETGNHSDLEISAQFLPRTGNGGGELIAVLQKSWLTTWFVQCPYQKCFKLHDLKNDITQEGDIKRVFRVSLETIMFWVFNETDRSVC